MKRAMSIVALLLATSVALAEECGKCPVSGEPASKDSAMDYKGKKVYLCCGDCKGAVEKDVAKYSSKIMHQLVLTGQAKQVGCPVSGKPVNAETMVEMDGAKFGFCCPGCKGKYEKSSADDRLAMIFGADSKAFTLQTTCPVSGKDVNFEKTAEHKGQKVYFCCDGCPKAFAKEPTKYEAKLPQFMK